MAKPTFLKTKDVTMTSPITEVLWHEQRVQYVQPAIDITASGDDQPSVTHGVRVQEIVALGSTYDAGGTALAKSNEITMTPTGINIHPYDWVINKRWKLTDVTGSGTAANTKAWHWGVPWVSFSVRAWVKTNGPDLHVGTTGSWDMSNDIWGTFSGTALVESIPINYSKATEGWVGVQFNGRYSGSYTYTKGAADLDAVFLVASTDPPRGTTTLAITSGDTITGTGICYDVTVRGTRRSGGPLPLIVKHRMDDPD